MDLSNFISAANERDGCSVRRPASSRVPTVPLSPLGNPAFSVYRGQVRNVFVLIVNRLEREQNLRPIGADLRISNISYFQQVIGRLQAAGCDAVVLGCTEIPLIMNDSNSALPTLDSTRLLARAALRRALLP